MGGRVTGRGGLHEAASGEARDRLAPASRAGASGMRASAGAARASPACGSPCAWGAPLVFRAGAFPWGVPVRVRLMGCGAVALASPVCGPPRAQAPRVPRPGAPPACDPARARARSPARRADPGFWPKTPRFTPRAGPRRAGCPRFPRSRAAAGAPSGSGAPSGRVNRGVFGQESRIRPSSGSCAPLERGLPRRGRHESAPPASARVPPPPGPPRVPPPASASRFAVASSRTARRFAPCARRWPRRRGSVPHRPRSRCSSRPWRSGPRSGPGRRTAPRRGARPGRRTC